MLFIFFASAVTAMAVENPVFARALGVGRETLFMKSHRSGILLGGALTWMVSVSSLLVAIVNFFMAGSGAGAGTRPIAYLIGVAAVYLLTAKVLLVQIKHPAWQGRVAEVGQLLPLATFNSALFGAFYISVSQNFGFFGTIGYAIGTGAGYTAALLAIYFARKRLAISAVPRSFRGLPVLLVYMGLVSLALYGLIGRVLPT